MFDWKQHQNRWDESVLGLKPCIDHLNKTTNKQSDCDCINLSVPGNVPGKMSVCLSIFFEPLQAINKDHFIQYDLCWISITSIYREKEQWNQNISAVVLGGSMTLPNSAWDCEHRALFNSVLWTDITAKCSQDLWLYPSQKQKWKLWSLGGLNPFQSFLFLPKEYFSPVGKEGGKKEHDTNYGIFFLSIWQRKCLCWSKWDMLLALNEMVCFATFYTYFLAKHLTAEEKHHFYTEFAGRN